MPKYKCIDCKHAWLDNQERIAHRLTGKPFLFECLIKETYRHINIKHYYNVSTQTHDCNQFEYCEPKNET